MQSHGRFDNYCLDLARKFQNNEETLVIHSINKQEFGKALQTINNIQDVDSRKALLIKYGLILSEKEPDHFIRVVKKQKLNNADRERLSAILLQVPKHAISQAA